MESRFGQEIKKVFAICTLVALGVLATRNSSAQAEQVNLDRDYTIYDQGNGALEVDIRCDTVFDPNEWAYKKDTAFTEPEEPIVFALPEGKENIVRAVEVMSFMRPDGSKESDKDIGTKAIYITVNDDIVKVHLPDAYREHTENYRLKNIQSVAGSLGMVGYTLSSYHGAIWFEGRCTDAFINNRNDFISSQRVNTQDYQLGELHTNVIAQTSTEIQLWEDAEIARTQSSVKLCGSKSCTYSFEDPNTHQRTWVREYSDGGITTSTKAY